MRIFWPNKTSNVELHKKTNSEAMSSIIIMTEIVRDRACAKETYQQHHKSSAVMDTRWEKEPRSKEPGEGPWKEK